MSIIQRFSKESGHFFETTYFFTQIGCTKPLNPVTETALFWNRSRQSSLRSHSHESGEKVCGFKKSPDSTDKYSLLKVSSRKIERMNKWDEFWNSVISLFSKNFFSTVVVDLVSLLNVLINSQQERIYPQFLLTRRRKYLKALRAWSSNHMSLPCLPNRKPFVEWGISP